MAKKQFGKELRRSSNNIKKKPLDISSAENLSPKQQSTPKPAQKEPVPEVKVSKAAIVKEESKKVQRTSINFPFDVYDALREHAFKNRISMRDYLVELIKKDLKL